MNLKDTIEKYLTVLAFNEGEESDKIQKLILSLDELALVSHEVDFTFDERDYPEPPKNDYKIEYDNIGRLFPSLGYYNIVLDISDEIGQGTLGVGDAIDDVVGIASDLREILWRFENTSQDDALFHFQLLFRSHWGMHLRTLQLYLYDFSW